MSYHQRLGTGSLRLPKNSVCRQASPKGLLWASVTGRKVEVHDAHCPFHVPWTILCCHLVHVWLCPWVSVCEALTTVTWQGRRLYFTFSLLPQKRYVSVSVCLWFVCLFYNHVMCLMGPEEGVGSPGAGVIASGKQPDVGAGVGTWVLCQSNDCWAIGWILDYHPTPFWGSRLSSSALRRHVLILY